MGQPLGETVGYQVRLEEAASPRTRLRFLTEGILARRALRDPQLAAAGIVVLDEFHERHADTDLAFALLRHLQATTRPDLRLVIMSATVDAQALSRRLDGCPVLHAPGQLHPLTIEYRPSSAEPPEDQAAGAVRSLGRLQGDVLIFLPGASEIRRALRNLDPLPVPAFPLHGDLTPAEQDRATSWTPEPKIICSTNVAESSVTLPGVRTVIDSGLARISEVSPGSGLPRLRVTRISQASARQRAGRAARLGPGRVVRLYPEADFLRRPEFDVAEIHRTDLTGVALQLLAAGFDPRTLPWLEPPDPAAWDAAFETLRNLGALGSTGTATLTETGRTMSEFPVAPRLARLLAAAARRGAFPLACEAVAALSLGERLPSTPQTKGRSDLIVIAEAPSTEARRKLVTQLKRGQCQAQRQFDETALLMSVVEAFPDRLGRRRSKASREVLLSGGGAATLDERSTVQDDEFLVAVDLEERAERSQPLIRLASGFDADWLLESLADQVQDVSRLEWNKRDERVEQVSQLCYAQLVLTESRGLPDDAAAAAALLAAQAITAGLQRFVDPDLLEAWRGRLAFLARTEQLELDVEELFAATLKNLSQGLRSFAELKRASSEAGWVTALLHALPDGWAARIDRIAPERLRLPSGRNTRVLYPLDGNPYVASRLQDFFGLKETPRIAGGRVPLLVHLLAPNQRPVQVTQDLAGFWERLYPQLRRELGRRYPRHRWPEDPYQPES
jgi:ATP-dependent helicase HrpB